MHDITSKVLKDIPTLLSVSSEPEQAMKNILDEINDVVGVDKAAIYYLSEENAYLKMPQNDEYFSDFCLEYSFIEDLENADFIEINETEITENPQNFCTILFPLKIKDSVFGFLCVGSSTKLSEEQNSALVAICSICAYSLKDAELSSVFKSQLKMMQSGLIDKSQAVEQIKEENERILAADKVKNEFLANVSHELRTPLNAIIGFSEVLNSKIFGDLNDKQSEYINDIYNSGVHLLGMINEILDISKIEANVMNIHKTEFLLEPAISEVVRVMKPLADKKQIDLKYFCNADVKICSDYQKLQQILYNLVGNAIKFTPQNGTIEVFAKSHSKNVVISVKDNGIGIPKDKQESIFEKFVQLETPYTKTGSSTGLGLTISKKFVEMLGGKISLNSAPSKGSEFIFEIPMN